MDVLREKILRAALLHDIGKLVLRAKPEHRTHSSVGVDFLRGFATEEDTDILRAIGHHHAADLRSLKADYCDISYLIYEADNLAAGTDRRTRSNGESGFSAAMPLASVFNVFGDGDAAENAFYLRGLRDEGARLYPEPKEAIRATQSAYLALYRDLEDNFRQKSPFRMSIHELLRVLEGILSYVPSSTARGEAADISLYDHLRLTAAYALAMYHYCESEGVQDYQEAFVSHADRWRAKPMYLLASGDLSGIQDFLYTIPSKGALKSLRGRSFYLEILLEHIADELLEAADLARPSLLYTGGGHFYMLLPNTVDMTDRIDAARETVNDWMLTHFGTRLSFAMASVPCSAQDFLSAGTQNAFARVGEALQKEKTSRYSLPQLKALFSPTSAYNHVRDAARECAICHTSVAELSPYPADEAGAEACPMCGGLYRFGQRILQAEVFCVLSEPEEDALPLPSMAGTRCLAAKSLAEVQKGMVSARRLYVKNQVLTGKRLATHLWMGDYVARGERGEVLEFEDLAQRAGGLHDGLGIPRIGVIRADVDNLGAAFHAGFSAQYATLTRTAVLSRQLSLFFKHYINALCAGEVNGIGESEHEKFSLFGAPKEAPRKVHVIYSGGDDLFLVGAWDEIIEFAVDLYRAFSRFTGGRLHFSAGIGLFRAAYPISDMARRVGELEDAAKALPGKDGVALFGIEQEAGQKPRVQAYHWRDFIEGVCGEKLTFLREHIAFERMDARRITMGKSALYRLLALLAADGASISLARFVYALARLEPRASEGAEKNAAYRKVRETFYRWYRKEKDRHELMTAVQLVIYGLREKGEKAG